MDGRGLHTLRRQYADGLRARAGPEVLDIGDERRFRAAESRCSVGHVSEHTVTTGSKSGGATISETGQPVTVLSASESWDLLAGVALGRLVTSVDGQPEIFPVNFVVQDRTVLFRTAEGTKLVSAAINNHVLFEADDHTVAEGWSVIVKGMTRTLRTAEELAKAERAQLLPWTGTLKQHYVRIQPVSITGRRFRFGPEPERESSFA